MQRHRRRFNRVGRHARGKHAPACNGRKPASAGPMHDYSIAVLSLFQRFAAAKHTAAPVAPAYHAAVLPGSSGRAGIHFVQQVQWYENRRKMACPILRLFCLNFRICALHTTQRQATRSPTLQVRMIGLISDRFRQSRARNWPYDVTAAPAPRPGNAAARIASLTPPTAHATWKSTPERHRNRAPRLVTTAGRRPGRPRPGSRR